MLFSAKIHRFVFLLATAMLAASLTLSRFIMSVAMIVLLVNWLVELDFKRKFAAIRKNQALLAMVSFYLLFAISVFWSKDISYAIHDLRIKLPLLTLPLIYATSKPLVKQEFHGILIIYVLGVLAGSISGSLYGFGILINDSDNAFSPYISHIRFALNINMALVACIFLYTNIKSKYNCAVLILAVWFALFLFLLKSLTGIVLLIVLTSISILWFAKKKTSLKYYRVLILSFLTMLLASLAILTNYYNRYNYQHEIHLKNLPKSTVNGNKYDHYTNRKERENGHLVWFYISEIELEKQWNVQSTLDYKDRDLRGNKLRYTLIRYLASKGLSRDSVGFSQLTDADIRNIENGMANFIYSDKYKLYPLFYRIMWEIDQYKYGMSPSGNSITQRWVYLQAGWQIFKTNWVYGVGVGDVKNAFKHEYATNSYSLTEKWQLRTHNQFLTILITLGAFLGIFAIGLFIYPFFYGQHYKDLLALSFFLISTLSFINEDTLETHAAVCFVAFFYAILIFARTDKKMPS